MDEKFTKDERMKDSQTSLKVKIQKLHVDAVIPQYAHGCEADAGMDLVAVEDTFLLPFDPTLVKTGIALELPPGVEGQVRPRSGLALKKGITVWNSPGTIDPSYRGEVGVILLTCNKNGAFIGKGERIAQLVFSAYERVKWEEVDELDSTSRGANGFGSTGL